MAGMDGRKLAEQARKLRPGLRVLLMSAYSEQLPGPPGVPAADYPFLCKPYGKQEIARAIRAALDEHL